MWKALAFGTIQAALFFGLTTGFLGGFTTFSAYSLDTVKLIENSQWAMASFYFLGSAFAGLLSTYLGLRSATYFLS